MANVKWTSELDSRRIDLIKEGFSYTAISHILNREFKLNNRINGKSVENRSRATKTTKTALFTQSNQNIQSSKQEVETLFPPKAYEINESITFTPEKKRRLKEIYDLFNDGKARKVLSLSDLHAPFIHFEAVERALLEHGDADVLVLNGDVFDGHALSDFDKLDDFDIEIEFEQVFTLLDVVTKMFDVVIWNGGNHDVSRFIRMVSRKFGNGMKKYVLKRLNPVQYVAEKYDNIIIVPNQFFQMGECVFTHPDGYSSALMSTALGQEKVIRANADYLLPNPKFTCVIQGHTHDLGEYYINDCKVIEQGCLTHPADYRFDKPSSRKWQLGFAVLHLNNDGTVDFNNTRSYSADKKS